MKAREEVEEALTDLVYKAIQVSDIDYEAEYDMGYGVDELVTQFFDKLEACSTLTILPRIET